MLTANGIIPLVIEQLLYEFNLCHEVCVGHRAKLTGKNALKLLNDVKHLFGTVVAFSRFLLTSAKALDKRLGELGFKNFRSSDRLTSSGRSQQ